VTILEALKILGLRHGCKIEDVKRQYRKLAMKYHPDKNKNCEKSLEKMKRINVAYQTCNDYYNGKLENKVVNFAWTGTSPNFVVDISNGKFTIRINL